MPEQHDIGKDFKRNFNIAHALCVMHQRAIILPSRNNYGINALGFPCFLSLILMMLWYMATHDSLMLLWIGFWLLCLIKRRIEAGRLAGRVHSHYDGRPINLGSNEERAKMIYEPILVGILGGLLCWFYSEQGWPLGGLPSFFLAGVVSLRFVEMVKQTAWRNRIQAMTDARIENESLAEDFQGRP